MKWLKKGEEGFTWKHYLTMVGAFFGFILIVLVISGLWNGYAERRVELEGVEQSAQKSLESWDGLYADDPERFDSDTAGADTPQGTLLLFADALEAGNVERASEYVMQIRRSDARRTLSQVESAQLDELAQRVRSVVGEEGLTFGDGRMFVVPSSPHVEFLRYPAGNWKITNLEGEVVVIPSED